LSAKSCLNISRKLSGFLMRLPYTGSISGGLPWLS